VPAFSGLATPRWDPEAKAIIVGISLNTEPAQLVRAGLESVAFQLRDMLEVMRECWGGEGIALRLDGQVARNDTLMQIVSDVLETPVERLSLAEHRSAMGASFLAGLETGLWSGLEDLSALFGPERVFYPKTGAEKTRELYAGWQDAVKRSRGLPTRG
jgi:glycerol kinase